jgi:branched-chain amino acid transport system substrate-binding protein
MNTRIAPLALAVAAALGLVACGQEEPQKAAEAPKAAAPAAAPPPTITVMIGHVAPLTGGIAHLGKDNENGARLAIEQANEAKIQIDGKEAKFVLVAEDDQADPKVGATVAQKLVDAKVAGVVGHLNSGTAIPASPIYNQAGIPVISGSATNPKLTEQGFKQQFRVVARDDQQGPAIANYLAATAKPKSVAVIDDATAYGAGLADEVEKTLKAAGVKVLAREKGTDKTTDWKAVLTKLKGRNPDAIFYGGMDATGGPMLKQGRELGIKAVFAFGDGACTSEMNKLAGDAAAEGLLCSQAGIPPQAASKKFLDAYKAKYNVDPIIYAPFTYDSANLLIEAMKKANSPDPAKYLPELQKIAFNGATGPIAFDDKGDRKDAEITIFTMKGGKLEPTAIVKSGKTIAYNEFLQMLSGAVTAAGDAAKAAVDAAAKAASDAGKAAEDAGKAAMDAAKK